MGKVGDSVGLRGAVGASVLRQLHLASPPMSTQSQCSPHGLGRHGLSGLVGLLVGGALVGALVGLVGLLVGGALVGALVGLVGALVGLTGALVGLTGALVGLTGALVG